MHVRIHKNETYPLNREHCEYWPAKEPRIQASVLARRKSTALHKPASIWLLVKAAAMESEFILNEKYRREALEIIVRVSSEWERSSRKKRKSPLSATNSQGMQDVIKREIE